VDLGIFAPQRLHVAQMKMKFGTEKSTFVYLIWSLLVDARYSATKEQSCRYCNAFEALLTVSNFLV